MSPKIQAIAELAGKALTALIIGDQDNIESALVSAVSEAQAQEVAAKLRIGFATVINLDSNALEHALSYSVAHKLTHSETIPDPNQTELPIDTDNE